MSKKRKLQLEFVILKNLEYEERSDKAISRNEGNQTPCTMKPTTTQRTRH